MIEYAGVFTSCEESAVTMLSECCHFDSTFQPQSRSQKMQAFGALAFAFCKSKTKPAKTICYAAEKQIEGKGFHSTGHVPRCGVTNRRDKQHDKLCSRRRSKPHSPRNFLERTAFYIPERYTKAPQGGSI